MLVFGRDVRVMPAALHNTVKMTPSVSKLQL
jgi:hypothetical protein